MAKARNQSAKPAAGAKKSTKQPAEKKAEAPAAPAVPAIDTGLAAATAAKLVAHKESMSAPATAPSHETAAFKQLKENLHKPVGQVTPSFLQNVAPTRKFKNSVPGRGQVGRNQTFGADVNRTGVPRRTGG